MDFRLTADQEDLLGTVHRIGRERFGPRGFLPSGVGLRTALAELAGYGLGGLSLAEELGGQGGSLIDAVLVIEAISRYSASAGDAAQALNFGPVQQLAHYGSDHHKARFLAPCLHGTALISIAMTEPGAGSAVSELRTSARRDADGIALSGQKTFSSNGALADYFLVWARFEDGPDGIGAVVVSRDADGLTIDDSRSFMTGERYAQLFLDDCRVPAENVLLDRAGFRRMFRVFNIERLGNASRSLAYGQAAFDRALDHVTQREQFGRRLADFQGLQWRLAEMRLKLESARLLLYRAAAATTDDGVPDVLDTCLAKLACNRAGFEVAHEAVQLLGGAGYEAESEVGYMFQRTRGWLIAGGTAEQMLNRIASQTLKRHASSAD
jgi:hypothetical protein